MGENAKQLKVENWGNVFLQCLHMFFSKTDFCDLTLQFEENQQLKVHRLVMNACTDYFKFLEQSCPPLEDSVIIMPPELQADVIVPIINFMYTGLLEFKPSLFNKIYKAADIMNITVLIKLLNAHKLKSDHKNTYPTKRQSGGGRKTKTTISSDLPSTLPGRKLPIWKRKNIPQGAIARLSPASFVSSASSSSILTMSPKKSSSSVDNTPRPTRFEWPDDEDLPEPNLFENSFEEISYNSKPLLTKEEELRVFSPSSSFDSIRNTPAANLTTGNRYKGARSEVDMEEVKDYIKEQKIRSGINYEDEEYDVDDPEPVTRKRSGPQSPKSGGKRVKIIEDKENDMTINIKAPPGAELDHQKIIAELFKKYPELTKKNKSIKLKITSDPAVGAAKETPGEALKALPAKTTIEKVGSKPALRQSKVLEKQPGNVWKCPHCPADAEFPLFYMFRKHMLDVHGEKFDETVCKYCGQKYRSVLMLHYHMYTRHAVKPPDNCEFPKCDACPHIAFSTAHLDRHKLGHSKDEISCKGCGLTYNCTSMLLKHAQRTGHMAKEGKNNFDCQYCTKRYTTTLSLFSHLKTQHASEAKKDGVVSIDETDEILDNDDEIEEDEYIVPDILEETYKEKVKIISDVKVSSEFPVAAAEQGSAPRPAVVESSEAEALNNVATGIATSLGLVDIVVLDENQQYILQQHPQSADGNASTTSGEQFQQNFNQVQHAALPAADIGSTDELVMVLTDHDYNDENNENEENNSNIVVLYSHPVEGQQGQFIATTQGNIVVNSQMGLLEIHNNHEGNNEESQENQEQLVLNDSNEGQIESIEMIQREIENHGNEEGKERKSGGNDEIDEIDSAAKGQELEPMEVDENPEIVKEDSKEEQESKDVPPEVAKNESEENSKEEEIKNEDVEETKPETDDNRTDSQKEDKEDEIEEVEEIEKSEKADISTTDDLEPMEAMEPMEVDGGKARKSENDNSKSSQNGDSKTMDIKEDKTGTVGKSTDSNAKMSILDDWDDTDSQQSEYPPGGAKSEAGDSNAGGATEPVSVNKLMDDWDEEEEVK